MGRNSQVVENVHKKSKIQALAEEVIEQAFRDLNSRKTVTRDSARAFLLAEDEGWLSARCFWTALAKRDPQQIEEQVRQQVQGPLVLCE